MRFHHIFVNRLRVSTHGPSIAAFLSFGFQAIAALAMLFAMARLLQPAEYTIFSLLLSGSQLGSIFLFEWLRICVSRFEPGATGEVKATLRLLIRLWAALTLAVGSLLALSAGSILGVGLVKSMALLLGAATQGVGDIALTALRSNEKMGRFAIVQTVRAGLSSIAAIISGLALGSGLLAFAAYATASLASYLLLGRSTKREEVDARSRAALPTLASYARYGVPAALASVLYMAIPVFLRWWVVRSEGLADAAGKILAIDLLQKPFLAVVGALVSVLFPPIVALFESGDRAGLSTRLNALNLGIVSSIVLMWFSGTLVTLFVLPSFIPDMARAGFQKTAPYAVWFFACQSYFQYNVLIPSYLEKNTWLQSCFAGLELCILSVLIATFAGIRAPGDMMQWSSGVSTVLLIPAIYYVRTANRRLCEIPTEI